MANGHVEIYDPLSNKDGQKSSVDGSDDDDGADGMEGTLEFKLLMVYTKRRRDEHDGGQTPEPKGPPVENLSNFDNNVTDKKKGKKKKKKKGFKKFFKFSCIKPKTSDDDVGQEACAPEPESDNRMLIPHIDEKEELEDAAGELAKIADEVPFVPSELQTDCPDDVEKLIALVLREAGDGLNERELKNMSLFKEIIWNYSFYKKVMNGLLSAMGLSSADPDSPGPHASPKTQIAVTCEATSRLSSLDTLPMNRLLGFGARFLKEYYSSWVQEQGGYEVAFESEAEDEVE
ncbi:apoptosis facilitator Bcl-2-like protein 14 [Cynoglossus semilaevis]|uniref:BCL2 like 14 n=1 Tax=Cynoglossus semilaevis TaxID=244447 RepID=A0A3P8VA02_CYNSE|nr:apoptosis facilitator Bcl-2-like protein 14 [Cynoglossus semilaevis]XP_008313661.1 apoptosis facilitator Bcl-2-like protein 14 [Cynoglossus semilaevis]